MPGFDFWVGNWVENGKMIPITHFIDVEGLLEHIDDLALNGDKWIGKSLGNIKMIGSLISALPKYIDTSKAPKSIDVNKLFIDVLKEGTGEATKEFHRHTLFIGSMHFMDLYNMDLERIKRCGVHYATPDCRIIPSALIIRYTGHKWKKILHPLIESKGVNWSKLFDLKRCFLLDPGLGHFYFKNTVFICSF